jgi:hypothetical protein
VKIIISKESPKQQKLKMLEAQSDAISGFTFEKKIFERWIYL